MLHPVLFNSLPSVRDILADPDTLFVIPTFQRPYAWEQKQIRDLKDDFDSALCTQAERHYFAHVHLVPIEWHSSADFNFIDQETPDVLTAIRQASWIRKTYAVVDGQQRLVTLYLLSILQELLCPAIPTRPFPNLFQIRLVGNDFLPRIILGTNGDHAFFRGLVNWLFAQAPGAIGAAQIQAHVVALPLVPHCPSSRRLRDAVLLLLDYFFLPAIMPSARLAAAHNIKMGLTELDTEYALTSFITLNDRGKALTTLEKLKALWLQRAVTIDNMGLIEPIHNVFGDLYRLADSCVHVGLKKGLVEAEDLLAQLLYHWLDMTKPQHEVWFSAEAVYEWFISAPEAGVPAWVEAAQQIHLQLNHLCTVYLEPASQRARQPSIHFPETSTLFCDYHSLLVKLELPNHLLALLLMFRQLHPHVEWHDRQIFPVAVNLLLAQPICNLLHVESAEIARLGGNANGALQSYCDALEAGLRDNCNNLTESRGLVDRCKSMLEAIERIAVLAWKEGSNPRAGFTRLCAATFTPQYNPGDFVSEWYAFCNNAGTYDSWYIEKLCNRNAPVSQYYLLYEWERHLIEGAVGQNGLPGVTGCRAQQIDIELEHILPAAWEETIFNSGQVFPQWGFLDPTQFQRSMLERIGNKALLWGDCNGAVGNDHPNIKAMHYTGATCNHNPNAPALMQIEKVGQEILGLGAGPSPLFKVYVELRCAEIATFALRRFCGS